MSDDNSKVASNGSTKAPVDEKFLTSNVNFVYFLPQSYSQHVGDLLTPSNYGEWVIDMTDSLLAKNKLGFVDGTIHQPTTPREKAAWTRVDVTLKGWLKASMTLEVRRRIRLAKTSKHKG
ncbi:unnamed protein product [Linum trigynum]|uniref:Retrotransposon Copia-like N-terminal domain-containing protein n=1 Tax=Linum trigynum TaxID=586398 RepID=A0AAV2CZX9_9ROSI